VAAIAKGAANGPPPARAPAANRRDIGERVDATNHDHQGDLAERIVPAQSTLGGMTGPKTSLRRYLQSAREALLWKLEGLPEYDIRRPLTPTGTNLLGLVKHLAGVESGYFGATFGRPFPEPLPWIAESAETNADMWATVDESRDQIISLYHRVWTHSDATIETLDLDAPGQVPWWPAERSEVTLHQILVHVIAETNRHGGHADIVRELIDGTVGLRRDNDNMATGDVNWWHDYRNRLERIALQAADLSSPPEE
jgi:uncharacterized damage-inducible protein DinB